MLFGGELLARHFGQRRQVGAVVREGADTRHRRGHGGAQSGSQRFGLFLVRLRQEDGVVGPRIGGDVGSAKPRAERGCELKARRAPSAGTRSASTDSYSAPPSEKHFCGMNPAASHVGRFRAGRAADRRG